MTKDLVTQEKNMQAVEAALVSNDLSKMSIEQRLVYYKSVCDSVGLNHMTQPFAFITLQGKITLYAKRDAADQLRKIHGVSVQILEKKVENGLYIVTVKAKDKTGRTDEATGIIPIEGLKGSDLANAMLKTETKAKRRVTLSLCGLGILDESELDTVSDIGFTENPQVTDPFKRDKPEMKDVTPQDEPDEIPSALNDPGLGEFVCRVGKKYAGMKLSEINDFELNDFVRNTQKWFKDEGKTPNAAWIEFFETAEKYLVGLETKGGMT